MKEEEKTLIVADCVAEVIIGKGGFVFEPERKNITSLIVNILISWPVLLHP